MGKETEKFLEAEEAALKLVETLKELNAEVSSYQTATNELDMIGQRLFKIIESTEKIVNNSHEVIKMLKEIGAPEILSRLTDIERKSSEELLKISEIIENLKIQSSEKVEKIEENINEKINDMSKASIKLGNDIVNLITKTQNKINEESVKQSRKIEKLKIWVILALTGSIVAIILQIIAIKG